MDVSESRPDSPSPRRFFKPQWENQFLCKAVGKNIQCLVCHQYVVLKKYNIQRHYELKHQAAYGEVVGEERATLVRQLKADTLYEDVTEEEGGSGDTENEHVNDCSTKRKINFSAPTRKKIKMTDESCAKEALNCMETLIEKVCTRDDFSVYGEHIASKLRNSGRSNIEIAIAQNEIDNICFKLIMGGFSPDKPFPPQ